METSVKKIYTDNPFVDNVIYYAKMLALNCTVKDEDEATAAETAESSKMGDMLISCVEKTATYELFSFIPKIILEKYIDVRSNLDVYAESPNALKAHLNNYSNYQATTLFNNLSSLARTVYVDHYDAMSYYIDNESDTWLSDNEELYNKCKSGEATYEDLWEALPSRTVARIVKTYLNNYDKRKFEAIILTLSTFNRYLDGRTDSGKDNEIAYINKAMRAVFISHYETMVDRGYFAEDHINWLDYVSYKDVYNACMRGKATYFTLFPLFPADDALDCMVQVLGQTIVDNYNLTDLDSLEQYFDGYSLDSDTEKAQLTALMSEKYMDTYNPYMDYDIYQKCVAGSLDYYDLVDFMPIETIKCIVNAFIPESTNLDVYEENKNMLNEYLASIPKEERDYIKENIRKDMIEWYPSHHVETNNYYRALCGLPPLENGKAYVDTLESTYNALTRVPVNFGDKFISEIPYTIYPDIHWKQEIWEFSSHDIGILKEAGIIDEYIAACEANSNNDPSRYKYLYYLGDSKLDIYTCRKGYKFDLIGIPNINDMEAKNKFIDCYNITKDYIVKSLYSDAYKFQSPYFDKFMIVFILINTIMEMLVNVPELIIDREVFDERCVRYILESYGIPYYSEIPLKYQKALVKNLNILIKYKSSTKNMIDICSLFGFNNVNIFNYYMFKYRNKDYNTGEYIFNDVNDIDIDPELLYIIDPTGKYMGYIEDTYTGIRYSKLLDWIEWQIELYADTIKSKYVNIAEIEEDGIIKEKLIINNNGGFLYALDNNKLINFNRLSNYIKIEVSDIDRHTDLKSLYIKDQNGKYIDYNFIHYSKFSGTTLDDIDPEQEYFIRSNDKYIDFDINSIYVIDSNSEYVDANGIHYIKFLDWVDNQKNIYKDSINSKYFKKIHVMGEDGTVVEKSIMNNNNDLYFQDPTVHTGRSFISFKELSYFDNIKDSEPATIKFIKVPVGESVIDYANDEEYISTYDEITLQDEGYTWDGGLNHEDLERRIIDYEFNAVRTKYISIESLTDISEMAFQVSYFYSMLFDNYFSEENLTMNIDYIKQNHKFKFVDVICYLFALTYFYNGIKDKIMYSPTQILYVKGFNFDEDLNAIINDARYFSQEDEYGPLKDKDKENIFSVNSLIASENYDYKEAFKYFTMKGFNLEADVDELEKWLNDNYQMSLEDFIVDDSLTEFDTVITMKHFYTLNNSMYQIDMFKNNILPLAYNNNILYAYDYKTYKRRTLLDVGHNPHSLIEPNDTYEIIDNNQDSNLYVLDNDNYLLYNKTDIPIYYKYIRTSTGLLRDTAQIYNLVNNEYVRVFNNNIYIKNNNGLYIMAANAFYRKIDGVFTEITEDRFFTQDIYEPDRKVLLFGEYYILNSNNEWVLDPRNCYVRVVRNGEVIYSLISNVDQYNNIIVKEEDCYVRHSDGKFIKLTETDYYRETHMDDDDSYNEYVFNEEDCYVISKEETEYYDPSLPEEERVYYKKLTDYYNENNYVVFYDILYVRDSEGNFIPETNLLHPKNCYHKDENGEYILTINYLASYMPLEDRSLGVKYLLILNDDYNYDRYIINDEHNYYIDNDPSCIWVYDSNSDYCLCLLNAPIYDESNQFVIVFKTALDGSGEYINGETTDTYDPEVLDKVWDENDWYYEDPSFDPNNGIRMNGENKWYYKKPGSNTESEEESDDYEFISVGSGIYLPSSAYVGDYKFKEGTKYYISFDITTNFNGKLQLGCEADSTMNSSTDRIYYLENGVKTHISQSFIANNIEYPKLLFINYDYDKYPIKIGDTITISDIRIMKVDNEEGYNSISVDIPSFDDLQTLYKTNAAIYKYLANLMVNCQDKRMYDMYKKLYDSLMVSKYNKEMFKLSDGTYAETFTEFLNSRDSVLYNRLKELTAMEEENMKREIANDIVEISYAMDLCLDSDEFRYLYSYYPGVSAGFIQQYMSKIINFFKSWKTHLLGINTVYKFGDRLENTIKVIEEQDYRIKKKFGSRVVVADTLKINPIFGGNSAGFMYADLYDDLEEFTHRYKNNVIIRDRLRIISRADNKVKITDHFDNEHVVLHSINHEVNDIDGELIINSNEASFTEENNELHMQSDESEQYIGAAQIIDEINHFSKDIMEWRLNDGKDNI